MMGIYGYRTKKELKNSIGKMAAFIETSVFGPEYKGKGAYCVVGPSPYVRKWYATVYVNEYCIIEKVT